MTRAQIARKIALAPLRVAALFVSLFLMVALTLPLIMLFGLVCFPLIGGLLFSPFVGLVSPATGRRLATATEALGDRALAALDRVMDAAMVIPDAVADAAGL
jgi:hypothetical protein